MKDYKTIDEYIANFSGDAKTYLETARKKVLEVAPDAEQTINYGMPTFKVGGKNLVHIAAYDTHFAFYPGSGPIVTFADDLKAYDTSKGTIRFPLDKPVPYDLIQKVTKAAVERNLEKKK